MPSFKSVSVIGAGAWGTALAAVAARAGREVILYARNPDGRGPDRRQTRTIHNCPACGWTAASSITATSRMARVPTSS